MPGSTARLRLHRSPLAVLVALPVALVVAACGGGNGGTGPEPVAPTITVTGVSDGAVVEEPVTPVITVDVGTFEATLDGQPFFSGSTVSEPGPHVLDVTARNQGRVSTARVAFEIRSVSGSLLILRMFDLGENEAGGGGDAILLTDSTAAGQRHALIDAGPAGPGGADEDFVQTRLEMLGVDTLEILLLTHAHTDHFGGMEDILRETHVRTFLYNGQERSFFRYENVVTLAGNRAEEVVVPGELIPVDLGYSGETELTVVPPLDDFLGDTDESSEINDGSLGTALTRGAFRMFFTGDGEIAANQRWRTEFASLTRDLTALKVGHHGANDAIFDNGFNGTSTWLEHTDPELRLITANGTTHPRQNALTRLLQGTATRTYCTNVHGDIEVRVDLEGDYQVTVQRNADMDCAPGEDATS